MILLLVIESAALTIELISFLYERKRERCEERVREKKERKREERKKEREGKEKEGREIDLEVS